jgi:hypothetical protein
MENHNLTVDGDVGEGRFGTPPCAAAGAEGEGADTLQTSLRSRRSGNSRAECRSAEGGGGKMLSTDPPVPPNATASYVCA